MVDEGRLARLLRGIAERTVRLRAAAATPAADRADLWLDGRPDDFDRFVADVSAWIRSQPG